MKRLMIEGNSIGKIWSVLVAVLSLLMLNVTSMVLNILNLNVDFVVLLLNGFVGIYLI